MGDTDLSGSVVLITYFPSREEQPGRSRVNFVSDALAGAYRNNITRGFESTIQIEEDGEVIYEKSTLIRAMARITELVSKNSFSIEDAARHVANEDGYF